MAFMPFYTEGRLNGFSAVNGRNQCENVNCCVLLALQRDR